MPDTADEAVPLPILPTSSGGAPDEETDTHDAQDDNEDASSQSETTEIASPDATEEVAYDGGINASVSSFFDEKRALLLELLQDEDPALFCDKIRVLKEGEPRRLYPELPQPNVVVIRGEAWWQPWQPGDAGADDEDVEQFLRDPEEDAVADETCFRKRKRDDESDVEVDKHTFDDCSDEDDDDAGDDLERARKLRRTYEGYVSVH